MNLTHTPHVRPPLGAAFCFLATACSVLSWSCTPAVRDGRFACDPTVPGSCPSGYQCQIRAPSTEFRCYQQPGPVCGDGYQQEPEACDGLDLDGQSCWHLEAFAGTPECTTACQLAPGDCRILDQLSGGRGRICGVDDRGGLWCWGGVHDSAYSTTSRPQRIGTEERWIRIATGFEHHCALDQSGAVYCWGRNTLGQLGNGLSAPISVATAPDRPVLGLPVVTEIYTQHQHSCALGLGGDVWCWGSGEFGRFRQGDVRTSRIPVRIDLPAPARHVATGNFHTCALSEDAMQVWCWGYNDEHQLGVPWDEAPEPGALVTLAIEGPFEQVVSGAKHSCVLGDLGDVWCWGANSAGQSGWPPTFPWTSGPVALELPGVATEIAAGTDHVCVLVDDLPLCWGSIASQDPAVAHRPASVPWAPPMRGLTAGTQFGCGIGLEHGRAWCWGYERMGVLGRPHRVAAAPVSVDVELVELSVSVSAACGLTSTSALWCWGDLPFGMGYGISGLRPSPTEVLPETSYVRIAIEATRFCGVTDAGALWCGGYAPGDGSEGDFAPALVSLPAPVIDVGVSRIHTCALTTDSVVYCWGSNLNWQAGLGTNAGAVALEPVAVAELAGIVHLAVGFFMTCALTQGGEVWCWGAGIDGPERLGSEPASSAPMLISLPPVSALSAGNMHTCAVDVDGQAWCWGHGDHGQLGNGSAGSSPRPVRVASTVPFASIAAAKKQTCGLSESGALWCWGTQRAVDLDGTEPGRCLVPCLRSAPSTPQLTDLWMSPSTIHGCALDGSGRPWCWGDDSFGQLGRAAYFAEPVDVVAPR